MILDQYWRLHASCTTRQRMSCNGRLCIKPLLPILLLCCMSHVSIAQENTLRVSQPGGAGNSALLDALQDDSISHIIIEQPVYNVRSEFAKYQGKPVSLRRCAYRDL